MGKNAKEALLLEIARRLKAVDVAGLQDTQQGVSNMIDKPEPCHLFSRGTTCHRHGTAQETTHARWNSNKRALRSIQAQPSALFRLE